MNDILSRLIPIFRFFVSVSVLFYIPGYVLVEYIFFSNSLSSTSRNILSIITSTLISSLIGSAILLITGRMNQRLFYIIIIIIVIIFWLSSIIKKPKRKEKDEKSIYYLSMILNTAVMLLMGVFVFFPSIYETHPLFQNQKKIGITEFYFSPGLNYDLVESSSTNEKIGIPLEIHNLSDQTQEYKIVIAQAGRIVQTITGVRVPSGGYYRYGFQYNPSEFNPNLSLDIFLFDNTDDAKYLYLNIWPSYLTADHEG